MNERNGINKRNEEKKLNEIKLNEINEQRGIGSMPALTSRFVQQWHGHNYGNRNYFKKRE